jgi:hypothetical protein
MSEPREDAAAAEPSALVRFLDAVAIEAYDAQIPSEHESPKTVQPDSRIIVSGRGRRDKPREARKEAPVASS